MKLAVANCSDTGPLESLHAMLAAAGYEVRPLGVDLANHLHNDVRLDNVGLIERTMRAEGTEQPFPMRRATPEAFGKCDLFVDVKGHRNFPKLVAMYPWFKDRVLWYRINGGRPEDRNGPEVDPPCPVLTPNLWYRRDTSLPFVEHGHGRYACWPPFVPFDRHLPRNPRARGDWEPPVCLVHNLDGWGYGRWAKQCREQLGLRIHGSGSPDGKVPHETLPAGLSKSLAMVHLKASDAPGYALLESLASSCPLIVSERLVENSLMRELFEDEETCLFFDRLDEPDLCASDIDPDDPRIVAAVRRIAAQLERLRDPELNGKIGQAGRWRLADLMWRADADGPGFRAWMERTFP